MTSVLPVISPSCPLVLQVFSSLKVFGPKLCMNFFYLSHAVCMSHRSLFAHPIILAGAQISSSSVNFTDLIVSLFLLLFPSHFQGLFFRILFPDTTYRFSSCNVRHQASYPYRATGKVVATHIYSSRSKHLLPVGSSSQFLSMHWYQPHST